MQPESPTPEPQHPFAAEAYGVDATGTFTLPVSFLIDVTLALPAGTELAPGYFFLQAIEVAQGELTLVIAYQPLDSETPLEVSRSVAINAGTHIPGASYALYGSGPFLATTGRVTVGPLFQIDPTTPAVVFAPPQTRLRDEAVQSTPRDVGCPGFQNLDLDAACEVITPVDEPDPGPGDQGPCGDCQCDGESILTEPGDQAFTMPITGELTVECWGGGGGGSAGDCGGKQAVFPINLNSMFVDSDGTPGNGGGGGGGGFVFYTWYVEAGTVFNMYIGAGGAGGTPVALADDADPWALTADQESGYPGETSWFGAPDLLAGGGGGSGALHGTAGGSWHSPGGSVNGGNNISGRPNSDGLAVGGVLSVTGGSAFAKADGTLAGGGGGGGAYGSGSVATTGYGSDSVTDAGAPGQDGSLDPLGAMNGGNGGSLGQDGSFPGGGGGGGGCAALVGLAGNPGGRGGNGFIRIRWRESAVPPECVPIKAIAGGGVTVENGIAILPPPPVIPDFPLEPKNGGLGEDTTTWTAGAGATADGLGGFYEQQNNYAGAGAPSVTDDADAGYSAGSTWVG